MELKSGFKTATELAEPFSMSLPAISKHLKILELAKLIKREKRGRQHFFSLNKQGLDHVSDWSSFFEDFWSESFRNLDHYLLENKGNNK